MIRAVSDWTQQLQEPFWANASLCLPRNPQALVVLAHNEGDQRREGVRRRMAEHLAAHRLASCTVGLTREDEHVAGRLVLDTETLADRLRGVAQFLTEWDETRGLPLAVFGEDYCGAAAIMVAAEGLEFVKAAGAYCGRADLARVYLPEVRVPTLLVVPGHDRDLLAQNERAFRELACPSQIAVVGNATRSLRESGAIYACCYLIRRWCQHHVIGSASCSHAC